MILDTNAVSALFRGEPGIDEVLEGSSRHSLPVITIGEYRFGLLRSTRRPQYELMLDALVRESHVLLVDGGTALAYATIRDAMRAAGTPLPDNDVWIAALARQHDEPIVSRDRHFDRVEGITRIGW
jgi:predicted nucleic acid-binding protein